MRVAYGCGSVLLWCNYKIIIYCSSSFLQEIMLSHNGPYCAGKASTVQYNTGRGESLVTTTALFVIQHSTAGKVTIVRHQTMCYIISAQHIPCFNYRVVLNLYVCPY